MSVREADIFRLWLSHYREHVACLAAAIIAEEGDSTVELEKLCENEGAKFVVHHADRFQPGGSMNALEKLVQGLEARWILHADSDEFLYEIADLAAVIGKMEVEKSDFAIAWMADRLAFGGCLGDMGGIISIEELEAAFPVRAAVTERLAKGCPYKVCLSRWPHFGAIHSPQPPLLRKASKRLTFEHFKWRKGLEARLEKRIRDHAASKLPWGDESRRILGELKTHGRIRAERWLAPRSHRIHGWMDYEDIYLGAVRNTPDGGHIVEVGVWQGRSLCFLAEAALASGKRFRIDGVDPFRNFSGNKTGYPQHLKTLVTKHSWLHVVAANLHAQRMLDHVNLIQTPSTEGAGLFGKETLDFVWIDGAHDYDSVLADLLTWWPKIKPGGTLAGHDYCQPQVRRAVSDAKLLNARVAQRGNAFIVEHAF